MSVSYPEVSLFSVNACIFMFSLFEFPIKIFCDSVFQRAMLYR